jgi:hypothetical protein
MQIDIRQIFYDWPTRQRVMPGFIPFDNSQNERPDWFELWPILQFLNHHELDDACWYGFFSPRFFDKALFTSKQVIDFIARHGDGNNVALFTLGWDQLAYFKNPWEQGELWHPGITRLTQRFLDDTHRHIALDALVTDSKSSVFSNYVVARKEYWTEWRAMALNFFNYVEAAGPDSEFSAPTAYGDMANYPIKTFIQERFSSLLLATRSYKVITPNNSLSAPIFSPLFEDSDETRRQLQACDLMKSRYRATADNQYLDMYRKLRADIRFTGKTSS